jgi:hypothetical protein
MELELSDPHPRERSLRHHPIHGKGFIDEDGYRNVNNYLRPFIRARDAPPHVWPINAKDWGFEEWLPSQTDMVPQGGSLHPIIERGLDEDGEIVEQLVFCHDEVYPAFSYRQVRNLT